MIKFWVALSGLNFFHRQVGLFSFWKAETDAEISTLTKLLPTELKVYLPEKYKLITYAWKKYGHTRNIGCKLMTTGSNKMINKKLVPEMAH